MISNGVKKGIIITIVIVLMLGAGAWYYFKQVHTTKIEKIFSNPTEYAGKVVTIEGDVTDRTAIFGALKFYKLRDKSGEIIVVTGKSLPETKSVLSVKGKIDNAFIIGDQKLLVFVEESVEKKENPK